MTGIDPEKFVEDSILKDYLEHEKVHEHGSYSTQKLLYLGFLFCSQSRTEQEMALWGIINSSLAPTVTATHVENFLLDISSLAVLLPLDHYESILNKAKDKERNTEGSWKIPV